MNENNTTLSVGSLGNITTGISPLGPKIKEVSGSDLCLRIKNLGAEYHFLLHEWPEKNYFMIEIMRERK